MSSNAEVRRLAEAVDALVARGDEGDTTFLARHDDLRELLEPMLERGVGEDSAPTRVGPYRILGELGRGGMGVVYRAEHAALHRRVALKILPNLLSLAPTRIERFLREAAAAARLDHPGIARVLDAGEQDGTFWYAMELVEGRTLSDLLAELQRSCGRDARKLADGPRLGIQGCSTRAEEIASIGAQVADALAHAHAHGVIHRDVKPQNLLVDEHGRVRLVDFGLAKDLAADGGDGSRTSPGYAGTPHYSSPEQVEPDGRTLDGRSDVFALGAVLYEVATLRRAFEAATADSVLRAVLHDEPRPLRAFDPRLPRDLEAVVQQALEKSPDARYATATDFAADLQRARVGDPVRARRTARWRKVVRTVRRHRAATVAVSCATALLVGGPSVAWIMDAQAKVAIAKERDEARGHFERARRAVDRLMVRVATEDLTGVPRMQELRRRLLTDARDFYVELAGEAGPLNDRRLQHGLAQAHARLGRALADIGEYAQAHAELAASIEVLDALARREAGSTDWIARAELAEARTERGLTHLGLGRRDRAETDFEAARTLWDELVSRCDALPHPVWVRAMLGRGAVLEHWASSVAEIDPARAGPMLEASRATYLELEEAGVDDPRVAIGLARGWIGIAELHVTEREFPAAAEAAVEARRVYELATGARALETEGPVRLLFTVERRVLEIRLALGRAALRGSFDDVAAGTSAYEEALDIARGLRADFPESAQFAHWHAFVCDAFARFLLSEGTDERIAELVAEGRAAFDEHPQLLESFPSRVLSARLRGLDSIARVFLGEPHRPDLAETAISELEELLVQDPGNIRVLSQLGQTLHNAGLQLLRRRTGYQEAFELLRRATAAQSEAERRAPSAGHRYLLGKHRRLLAYAALKIDRPDVALETLLDQRAWAGDDGTRLVEVTAGLLATGLKLREGEDAAAATRAETVALELLDTAMEHAPDVVAALPEDRRFVRYLDDQRLRSRIERARDRISNR